MGRAQRTAEALFCAAGTGVTVFADALTDIDRGYFVRNGVLDQTCNPRRAARVIGHLHAALNEGRGDIGPVEEMEAKGRWLRTRQNGESIALYMAGPDAVGAPLSIRRNSSPPRRPVTAGGSGQRLQIPGRRTPPRVRGPVFFAGALTRSQCARKPSPE